MLYVYYIINAHVKILVKYTRINRDNFPEMFSLKLSLHSPYCDEACNEFAKLISAS